MKIGILGVGNMGSALGGLWAQAGHAVLLAARTIETASAVAKSIGRGAKARSVVEAAAEADVVLAVVPYNAWPELAQSVRHLLAGKILMDATNLYVQRDGAIAREVAAHGAGSSGLVQSLLPTANVVKAFNMLNFKFLQSRGGQGIGIAYATDIPVAGIPTAALIQAAGFEPVNAGELADGQRFEPGTPVYNIPQPAAALQAAMEQTATPAKRRAQS